MDTNWSTYVWVLSAMILGVLRKFRCQIGQIEYVVFGNVTFAVNLLKKID